ncbi:MAG: nitrilase-related carbon-nitrogen hydrolase, partial [bacterium]
MKIHLAQLNPTAGDIKGNLNLVRNTIAKAASQKPDLVVFPELFITGYPPQDLLERNWFVSEGERALAEVKEISLKCPSAILIGGIARSHRRTGRGLYNCAFAFYQGKELFQQAKSLLPFYDVFDEARYFDPAPEVKLWEFNGERIGVSICEDAWNRADFLGKYRYEFDPINEQYQQGATLFINIAASPFWLDKPLSRLKLARENCQRYRKPFIFVNSVGAQDELIFDGHSFVIDSKGVLT